MGLGILDDAHTFTSQPALKKFRYISIFPWQKLIATLHDRNLDPKATECLREFTADRSTPEHDHVFQLSFHLVENRFVCEIGNRVDALDSWNCRTASCSDHKILRAKSLTINFDFIRRNEPRFAVKNIHTQRFESLLRIVWRNFRAS